VRLSRIAAVLRAVVPQFEALEFNDDDPAKPHVVARFRHWRDTPALQTERQFSDGTLRLIGFLWTLQESGGPLLLEEPELSLHPGIVRHLAPFIWRAQRRSGGRQVIVSTHSDSMLSDPGIRADEVLLVAPEPQGNGSVIVSGAARADIVRLMNAGLVASEAIMPMSAPAQGDLLATLAP
jgi:predicted ATPase